MTEERSYKKAAILWFVTTGLVLWMADRHFTETTADLLSWIPFAMCLRCTYKWWRAKKLGR